MTPGTPEVLLRHLAGQRRHVLGILDGLDDAQLRAPVLPSGWSCLGMVRHLTLDDEQFWFSAVLAGDPAAIEAATGRGPDDAWQVPGELSAEAVLAGYRAEAERSDAVARGLSPAAPPAWWPDFFGDWRLRDVEDVLLHVITETACHAGHLDAARELLDGRRWMVLE
jgi:hypothetical protein